MKSNDFEEIRFKYFLPANIIFGRGVVDGVGEIVAACGKKALIVTGGSSAKKSGLYDRVKKKLEDNGVESLLFDRVTQNPLTTTAEEGAALAREKKCEVVVAAGGGSVMDCAKAIAFLAANDGDINDYIFARLASDKALPLVLIPTTCGTGSEGNGFSVLTNPETGDKKSLRCNAIIAKASLVDPECMMTMPKSVLASVGFDALCHNIEAYTSKISQPFTDALSLYAISLTAKNLPAVYKNQDDIEAWEKVTLASTIGGMVINTAGVTLAHGMEHPASGFRNIVHGKGLAAIEPVVTDASYEGSPKKFDDIARLLGRSGASECGNAIRALEEKIELRLTLSELGIEETDILPMAENCMKVSSSSIKNNPVEFSEKGIIKLYEKSFS